MSNVKRISPRKIILLIGCLLIVCSLGLLIWWQATVHTAGNKSEEYAKILSEAIPEPQNAVLEERSDNMMPVLALDGMDFVGILEFPLYDTVLPVCAQWDTKLLYPSCYTGSVYDGSLKIGATTQKGQFDFYREISVSDTLYFTDMTGNRYAYEVSDIVYRNHADNETLSDNESELTIFIKNIYATEYVIIRCNAKG